MMILKGNEVCPHTLNCPYSDDCKGANPLRNNKFTCEFVSNNGIIESGKQRNKFDDTGRMEIISENDYSPIG